MSQVVLLAINAKYIHSSLAVWYLADGIAHHSQFPHTVNIVEATIKQDNTDIAGRVAAYRPDVVGISTYIWNAGKLTELLALLRQRLPRAVFVLGGHEATHNPEFWLAQNNVAYVLRGEAEQSFPALLDVLVSQETPSLESVSGLCWKQKGKTHANREAPPLNSLTDPYSEAYFNTLNSRLSYIETSRGCPFRCSFCLSGGSNVRFFPLDKAKENIDKLSQSGTKTIKFVDRTFNCESARAYDLLEYVIGLDTSCSFHFEVAADLFDERALSILASAPTGRIQLEAGLQSFHEPALKATVRKTDLAKAQRNIRTILRNGNIHIHVDLIAGLPYESLSHFQDSFDKAYDLGAHTLQLGFLKLLYGSQLRNQAASLGICYQQEPPYEIISSPWLNKQDLKRLKQTENALQHTYNKGRFLSALGYVLSASKLRPFALYNRIGEATPNHGTPLEVYARQIFDSCISLPGVDPEELRSHMICDWLAMVKGHNMPTFLKAQDKSRKDIKEQAQIRLHRKVGRDETALLPSGQGIFVDSHYRDPVTGLYRVYFL